ncbi:hypothetical protein CUJ84_Chr003537 [Rhizobium leguminosarum]|uniref:Uncharacterized protein n=1 Tax=Rhizobium leguminosarum TaxID=384 RepID=A0A2K9Z6K3_RHILE|nr:hypothetical protein CUJ84_Chr003537 [Rhizobium leguminosarum]
MTSIFCLSPSRSERTPGARFPAMLAAGIRTGVLERSRGVIRRFQPRAVLSNIDEVLVLYGSVTKLYIAYISIPGGSTWAEGLLPSSPQISRNTASMSKMMKLPPCLIWQNSAR